MKNLILFFGLLCSLNAFAQVSPVMAARIPNAITAFGQNLPVGTQVFLVSDTINWIVKTAIPGTATMTTAATSLIPVVTQVKGTLPITTTGINGKVLIGVNLATNTTNGTITAAEKIKLAGLITFPGFGITHALASYGDHLHQGIYEVPLTFSSGFSRVGNTVTNTLTGFPGFGVTHTLAAYGDHAHSTYLPLTGGTLTGTLNGTAAYFSSAIFAPDFCRSSDIRLKKNVRKLNDTDLWKASQIEFYKYTYIADTTNTTKFGPMAQEVEQLFPELVATDSTNMKSVYYLDLLIVVTSQQKEAIKMLEKRIKSLENER